jgi:hypothetical protein
MADNIFVVLRIIYFSMQALLKNMGAYVDTQNWQKADSGQAGWLDWVPGAV